MAQQTIDIGAAPNDGTGDPIRDAFDKCNDNFTELYGSLAGLLDFQGATDCSANPNYPAASQGDIYIVSIAGKIGGASGKDVEVGDFYLALADNAGGTEASVGTSWAVLQANITGGIGSGVDVEDEGVSEATGATTLNFVGAGVTAADAGGGVVDITIPGGGGGVDVEDEGVSEATGVSVLNFTGAGVTASDAGGGTVDVTIPGGGAISAIGSATIATSETRANSAYGDLATPGPAVTLTTGTDVIVTLSGRMIATGGSNNALMAVDVSGATTLAAADANSIEVSINTSQFVQSARTFKLTGLTPGSNTFTVKYKNNANTANFAKRDITVMAI